MQLTSTEQGLELVVDNRRYSEAVLHKCFYWYTRDYQVTIEPISAAQIRVRLVLREGVRATLTAPALRDQVHNDLLDFKLRELIASETRPVRELLIAKAFAHYAPEQPLLAAISDPIGFHPPSPPDELAQ